MNQERIRELKIIATKLIGDFVYSTADQVHELPLEGLDKREKEFVATHIKKIATTMKNRAARMKDS